MVVTQGQVKRFFVSQVTLNGTTEVTLTVPNLELNSIVIAVVNTIGGTPSAHFISTKTPGAAGTLGFKALASNTSVLDVFVLQ